MGNPAGRQNCRNVIGEMMPGRYYATALYRLIIRCDVDRLRMAGDLHRSATVLHAGLRIPEDLLGLLPVVVVEATLVRHPHAAPSFFRQHEFVVDDVIEIKHVSSDSVELIVGERFCVAKRHSTADIVEYARQMSEIRADCFDRIMRGERAFALRKLRPPASTLTELAMASGALIHVDFLAVLHRAAARWRTLPVGAYVDIPPGNLLRCGDTADAVVARSVAFYLRAR